LMVGNCHDVNFIHVRSNQQRDASKEITRERSLLNKHLTDGGRTKSGRPQIVQGCVRTCLYLKGSQAIAGHCQNCFDTCQRYCEKWQCQRQ
jgi:hypothetical protein